MRSDHPLERYRELMAGLDAAPPPPPPPPPVTRPAPPPPPPRPGIDWAAVLRALVPVLLCLFIAVVFLTLYLKLD